MRVVLYSDNIDCYDKLYDADGNVYRFRVLNRRGDSAVIAFDSVTDRTAAEKLKGTYLYIKREDLPQLESSKFYVCDLVGSRVSVQGSNKVLKIIDVKNFGAGDLIELSDLHMSQRDSFYVPFTKSNFPEVNGVMFLSQDAYKNFKDGGV